MECGGFGALVGAAALDHHEVLPLVAADEIQSYRFGGLGALDGAAARSLGGGPGSEAETKAHIPVW